MNKNLLKRYFDNTCTTEEREKVILWLSDPRNRDEVLVFMEAEWDTWQPSTAELEEAAKEVDLPFDSILHKSANKEENNGRPYANKRRLIIIAASIAASVLFLVLGAGIGYYYHGRTGPDHKAPLYYATAQTLRGQRSKLVLSDGSEVYLNAESRLSFSNEVSSRPVVYLEGEAFFKVPAKEKPLIIKTKDLVASTKGSQFNISAFPRDSTVTVSVEKGRTEIRPNNEKTFPLMALRIPGRDSAKTKDSTIAAPKPKLMPMMAIRPVVVVQANESVTYDKTNQLTTAPARLNENELSSWKEGFIYFTHVDSTALVDKLERFFDVEVILDTKGAPMKQLNCGFRNATLIQVLDHIGNDLDLDYRIEGKKVYLTRRSR